jgi:uncharacterized membrane protein
MNLDLLPLGWVHFVASLIAIAVGAAVLMHPKGTAAHKGRGRLYAVAVVATSLTALGIYRIGGFFFAHWFGVAALIVTTVGVTAAHFRIPRFGWIHVHLTCMVTSFYILIGGALNEIFLRVTFFRRLVPSLNSPLVGTTHLLVMVVFAALIGYFNVVALLRTRPARPTSFDGEAARRSHS